MINEELARSYCCEDISLIENYQKALLDTKNTWNIHHRLELEDKFGNILDEPLSMQYLIDNDLYYARPAKELIFLTRSEHLKLHRKYIQNDLWYESMKKAKSTEEHKKKLREIGLKLIYWNNGKINKRGENCPGEGWVRGRLSYGEGYKKQRSVKQKEVWSRKEYKENFSLKMKGKKWFNNGIEAILAEECPPGYIPGRKVKSLHWYNNGVINVQKESCPDGFMKGKLFHKRK